MLAMTKQIELSHEEIGRALKYRREILNLTQKEMGNLLGKHGGKAISGQAYQRFESGQPLKPSDLETALKALGINFDQLADYVPATAPPGVHTKFAQARQVAIPVYGIAKFSQGESVLEKSNLPGNVIDASPFFSGTIRAVQAPDNRMSPAVHEGKLVFFDLNTLPTPGQLCVVETSDNRLMIRNYVKQDGSNYFFEALFPERRTDPIPRTSIIGQYAVKFLGN